MEFWWNGRSFPHFAPEGALAGVAEINSAICIRSALRTKPRRRLLQCPGCLAHARVAKTECLQSKHDASSSLASNRDDTASRARAVRVEQRESPASKNHNRCCYRQEKELSSAVCDNIDRVLTPLRRAARVCVMAGRPTSNRDRGRTRRTPRLGPPTFGCMPRANHTLIVEYTPAKK